MTGDGEFCVKAARCVSGVKATRLVSLRLGVVIGAVTISRCSGRAGAGVLEAKAEGSGRALLGLAALAVAPRNMALTLSNRLLGLLTAAASAGATRLAVGRLFVVADRGMPPSVAFDGDLASRPCEGVFTLMVRDRDDLVGDIRDARVDFDRGMPNPADLGTGIELPSRETGRLLDASSSTRCRARLAGAAGSSTVAANLGLVAVDAGVGCLERTVSGSSRHALDWLRLTPALSGVVWSGWPLKADGWFAIESIFLNWAMWAAL